MTRVIELMPCPCCGSQGEMRESSSHDFFVKCSNPTCGMRTKNCHENGVGAAMTWNKRIAALGAETDTECPYCRMDLPYELPAGYPWIAGEIARRDERIAALEDLVRLMAAEFDYMAETLPGIKGSARFGAVRGDVRDIMEELGIGAC